METMQVVVTRNDGAENTYRLAPVVVVAFEREFKIGLGRAFGEGAENRAEHMYWLAWKAVHASGETVPVFDRWLETIAGVDLDSEPIGPFDGAPPDG